MRLSMIVGDRQRVHHAAAVTCLLAAAVVAGCSPVAGGTAAPTSPSAESTGFVDVGDYRGGIARTGTMPGPGPADRPSQVWRRVDAVGLSYPAVVASGWVIVPAPRSLVAIDARTGAAAWELALPADVAATITAANSVVYVPTADGVLRAFSLTDRRALWTFDGIIDGSQVSVSGATVYVGTSAHRLVALDARTGIPLWSVRAPTSTAKMAIDGDVAVVGGDGGGRASAIDLRTHRVLWTLDTQAQRVATPVVVDGSAYVAGLLSGGRSGATSRLFSLDVGDGSVRWTFTPPDHVSLAAFAVTAHDVIVGSDTDQGVVYDLDRADGRIRWRSAIGTAVDRPAVVGDTVYVGTGRGGLHALDLVAGQERWEVPVPGYSEGVVVTGGVAFVSSHDAPDGPGSIAAFAVH